MEIRKDPSDDSLTSLKHEAIVAILQQGLLMTFVGLFLVPKVVPIVTVLPAYYGFFFFVGYASALAAYCGVEVGEPLFIVPHVFSQALVTILLIILAWTSTSAIVYRLSDDTLPDWKHFLEDCLNETHCEKLMHVAKAAMGFTLFLLIWLTATAAWRVFSYYKCIKAIGKNSRNSIAVVKKAHRSILY